MKTKFDVMVSVGFLGVVASFLLGVVTSKGKLIAFFNIPSLIIVIFGALMSSIITYSSQTIPFIINGFKLVFQSREYGKDELIKELVEISKIVRKSGFLAVEDRLEDMNNPFLKKGLQLVIDGMEPDVIKEIMELEMEAASERHDRIIGAFNVYGEFLPAFGMIGTLVGLIIMLADLSDSQALGTGMSAALITTLYGAFFSNGIILPIAKKLQAMSDSEYEVKDLLLKGILDIQTGASPRFLEEKFLSFCSPVEKVAYFKEPVQNELLEEQVA